MDENNNGYYGKEENEESLKGEYREPERVEGDYREPEIAEGDYRDPGRFSGMDNNYSSSNPGNQGQSGNGFGVASLILGIVSLVGLCFCLGPITGLLAIVFGIIHISRTPEKRAFGIAGIITGAMGVILSIIIFVIIILGISTVDVSGSSPVWDMYEEIIEEQGREI